MTLTTNATTAKKDTQKLQRAIVDGLEDVKAQDIEVFDTEHLSALFERVIVASGTSNRQTKALAASVRDAVKSAGFPPPRVEGETNGEWIIVDCGAAVVHVMQPAFRQYYHLEELWGDKPVRLKLGAAKPITLVKSAKADAAGAPAKKVAPSKDAGSLRRSSAAKKGVQAAFPSKAEVKKAAAKAATKAGLKTSARPGAKTAAKKPALKRVVVGKAPVKAAVKAAGAKTAVKKPSAIRRKAP